MLERVKKRAGEVADFAVSDLVEDELTPSRRSLRYILRLSDDLKMIAYVPSGLLC